MSLRFSLLLLAQSSARVRRALGYKLAEPGRTHRHSRGGRPWRAYGMSS